MQHAEPRTSLGPPATRRGGGRGGAARRPAAAFADCVPAAPQLDDPLDAIAVHAWNGLWGVWSVGFFASRELIFNSYGTSPQVGTFPGDIRPYGCFLGGGGLLLASQVVYSLWIIGASGPLPASYSGSD